MRVATGEFRRAPSWTEPMEGHTVVCGRSGATAGRAEEHPIERRGRPPHRGRSSSQVQSAARKPGADRARARASEQSVPHQSLSSSAASHRFCRIGPREYGRAAPRPCRPTSPSSRFLQRYKTYRNSEAVKIPGCPRSYSTCNQPRVGLDNEANCGCPSYHTRREGEIRVSDLVQGEER